jgi:hypothetical protein
MNSTTTAVITSYVSSGGLGVGWEGGLFIATTSMTGVITTLILCSIFMHVRRRQRKHALRRLRVPQPRYAFYYPGWSVEDEEEGGEGRWQEAAELALEEPTELPVVPYYSPLAASMVQRTPLASPGQQPQHTHPRSPLTSLGPELAERGENDEEEAQDVEEEEEEEEPLALNAKEEEEEEEEEKEKEKEGGLQAREDEALEAAAALYEAQLEEALSREAAEQAHLATLPGVSLHATLPTVICAPFLCGGGGMGAVEDTHRPHPSGPPRGVPERERERGDGARVGEGRGEQEFEEEWEEEEEEWEGEEEEEEDTFERGRAPASPTHLSPSQPPNSSAAITPRPPIHRFHPRNSNSSERRRRRRAIDGGDIFPVEAAYEPPLVAPPPPPPSLWSSLSCSGEGGVGVENTHIPTSPNNPRFHHAIYNTSSSSSSDSFSPAHAQQRYQQQQQPQLLQPGSYPLSTSPFNAQHQQQQAYALEQRALALRAYVHPSLSLTTSPAPAKRNDPVDVSSNEPNPTATPSPPHPASSSSFPLSGGLSDRVGGGEEEGTPSHTLPHPLPPLSRGGSVTGWGGPMIVPTTIPLGGGGQTLRKGLPPLRGSSTGFFRGT